MLDMTYMLMTLLMILGKGEDYDKFFERTHSFDQNIQTTTRNTRTTSSLLDVAFTSMKYIKEAGVLDSFLSDHQPIFILKKKEKNREKEDQIFEGRSYRNYEKQQFIDNVSARNWKPFYDAKNPASAWAEMQNIIVEEANKICPVKKFTIRNTRPSWITNELLEQMKDRDYFYKKAKQTLSEDDWNIAKFHRNQVNLNIRRARADFIKKQLRNNEGNSAKFWRTIKKIMPSKSSSKKNSKRISLCDEQDQMLRDEDVAGHMNTFFANLGRTNSLTHSSAIGLDHSKLVSEFDSGLLPELNLEETVDPDLNQSGVSENFNIEMISNRKMETLISKINISKSSGIELLSSRLLKDSFQTISNELTYLFNFSLQTASFPDQWKKALVIPIPKAGNLKQAVNYRPISLLPLPEKMLEKLVHTQLSTYLEENEILSNSQFGFRKQRNTSHAISQLLNQIYTNINKSTITTAIYVDFSKAFNCVQHSTLLNKLATLKLDNNLIQWIASYLMNREQRTLANNVFSTYLPVPGSSTKISSWPTLIYHLCK